MSALPAEKGPEMFFKPRKGGISMLIIDPQVDFHPGGSLAVPGANEDSDRIASFLRAHNDSITQVNVTLDSHQRLHIAHAVFWRDAAGNAPPPFTQIGSADVASRKWTPVHEEFHEHALAYTRSLEEGGRFGLCIWPEHCIVASRGHAIIDAVHTAVLEWSAAHMQPIHYVHKGTNCFTEHYSALRADVEMPDDPETKLNVALVDRLLQADQVVICGQALSHCVRFTALDLASVWPKERMSALTVLTDCSSSVPGFENTCDEFLRKMRACGATVVPYSEFSTESPALTCCDGPKL